MLEHTWTGMNIHSLIRSDPIQVSSQFSCSTLNTKRKMNSLDSTISISTPVQSTSILEIPRRWNLLVKAMVKWGEQRTQRQWPFVSVEYHSNLNYLRQRSQPFHKAELIDLGYPSLELTTVFISIVSDCGKTSGSNTNLDLYEVLVSPRDGKSGVLPLLPNI